MRVNLNKVAEQIVPEYRYKQFVDSVTDLDLPPLYSGNTETFYPTTIQQVKIDSPLRRYIFKYNSNGSFEFITTRRGQRNGGNNVSLEDSQINVTITDPEDNFSELASTNFTAVVNGSFYKFGEDVRVVRVNERYLWQEKAQGQFVFNTLYYSEPTDNPLEIADKENDVNWFVQDTGKYVVANSSRVVYYNNNTLAGLNSWPIQNVSIDEARPEMMDDMFLAKCFKDVLLEAYDTVFVEVYWKEYTNREFIPSTNTVWIGESFSVPARKGRVYRVGKLAKSNDVGEYDVITFAQRTRIKTTTTKRGGDSVYN